jgi:hypothetical protein
VREPSGSVSAAASAVCTGVGIVAVLPRTNLYGSLAKRSPQRFAGQLSPRNALWPMYWTVWAVPPNRLISAESLTKTMHDVPVPW